MHISQTYAPAVSRLLAQSFWHATFHSCFPHFINALAYGDEWYSTENRRSRGFRREPIRCFPHGNSAKYFTHYALRNSANYKHPIILESNENVIRGILMADLMIPVSFTSAGSRTSIRCNIPASTNFDKSSYIISVFFTTGFTSSGTASV